MRTRVKPNWLKIQLPKYDDYSYMKEVVGKQGLNTICTSGKCPNIGECWGNRTATFMILGNICTRSCKFCNVATGQPLPPNMREPNKVAMSIKLMQLKHAVITSVDRDDLKDKGAQFWAETIRTIKSINPNTTIEVLIPDFGGIRELIDRVIAEKPEVISHNLETVSRLTPKIRSRAKYNTSLRVLKQVSDSKTSIVKTGIMVGLGETKEEIIDTMKEAYYNGVQVFTIGQYLQPTKKHYSVLEYIHPDVFEEYKRIGEEEIGLAVVESGAMVRSSYHAEKHIHLPKKEIVRKDV